MLALLLAASLPVSALADTYDLAQGSVTVTATESGQTVTQENNPDRQNFADSNPIITGTATENTVTIKDRTITLSRHSFLLFLATAKELGFKTGKI